jgi:osmotically-inducible protein OsmY
LPPFGVGYGLDMANPLQTLTKVAGYGFQQGTKIVGGAVQTVQGLIGGGGDDDGPPQQEQKPSRAEEQRQRQQKAAQQRRASKQPKDLDDVAITRKVETEIFRGNDVEKGKIDVNTADGVVWLRGVAKNPEQIKELEAKANAIPEVKRVENLLHLPKTPAPTRTDTPAAQRKTTTTKPSGSGRKVSTGRTTGASKQATSSEKEPAPAAVAGSGSGRPAAPLGDEGNGSAPGS